MPNRLADEISPYLLQHAENPVDWYPWGKEALERAKELDRPIFLSIGYSACHWCHVMERESFEDESIAAILNDNFVSIKVDREERPDLDQIYMQAVMALRSGQGGWPLSAFLTPTQEVFFGGTYWPPTSRGGMPGFDHVLNQVLRAYRDQSETVAQQASRLSEYLQEAMGLEEKSSLTDELLLEIVVALDRSFDSKHGGFGSAPKFPHPMDLKLLLQLQDRWPDNRAVKSQDMMNMVQITLDRMAAGGIYDHLGGGFARYSVDREWLVPHFEKMLYDNAQLAGVYLDAHLRYGDATYARIVKETLDYTIAQMTDEEGGFHSTEDADSEGEEGKFYVWTRSEIEAILDPNMSDAFCHYYGVTEHGNFEHGNSILHQATTLDEIAATQSASIEDVESQFAQARQQLFAVREKRIRPGKDDKVIVCWNGLMIDAMARAGAAFQSLEYLQAAGNGADYVLNRMRMNDGRLFHSSRLGKPKHPAFLDDYGAMIGSLVTLYETTYRETWISAALELAGHVMTHFHDEKAGGFFYVADDHERLIARTKDWQDSSIPCGNSLVATSLLRLAKLTSREDLASAAEETIQLLLAQLRRAPMAGGQALIALDMLRGGISEWVLVSPTSEDAKEILGEIHRLPSSRQVLSVRFEKDDQTRVSKLDQIHESRVAIDDQPTLYVCRNSVCKEPWVGTPRVLEEIKRMADDVNPIIDPQGDIS